MRGSAGQLFGEALGHSRGLSAHSLFSAFKRGAARLIVRLYPERQLIYCSRGMIRYASFSRNVQIALTVALLIGAGWVLFTTTQLVVKNVVIADKDRRITEMRMEYESLEGEWYNAQRRFDVVTSELEAQHRLLVTLLGQKSLLEEQLGATTKELDKVAAARDRALSLSGDLADRVVTLKDRLAHLRTSQYELIGKIQRRTNAALSELESVIEITGLTVDDLAERERSGVGRGGPFIRFDPLSGGGLAAPGKEREFEVGVLDLEDHLARWETLQNILERLPLAPPVDHYSIASGFGKRRDPFTKKWAMHGGVDFTSVFKTPIYATAPGVVTFVGRNGPYGKMVEIDHGLGLKSRYGHLTKILVKSGEDVTFRHKIGLMGSTGRSTGSHVHYEVLFRGKPLNPMNFLKAGRHIFKN